MYTDGGYQCENCKRQFARENLICPSCEYPITGTEDEKNLFYHKLETARHELKGMEEKIHQAKLCLWIIAGVNLFYGLLYYMFQPESNESFLGLLINLAVSISFVILAMSANEKPRSALIGGLLIYIAIIIYGIVITQSGLSIMSLFRYAFIVWIAIGISNSGQVEQLKKEINRRTGQRGSEGT